MALQGLIVSALLWAIVIYLLPRYLKKKTRRSTKRKNDALVHRIGRRVLEAPPLEELVAIHG